MVPYTQGNRVYIMDQRKIRPEKNKVIQLKLDFGIYLKKDFTILSDKTRKEFEKILYENFYY